MPRQSQTCLVPSIMGRRSMYRSMSEPAVKGGRGEGPPATEEKRSGGMVDPLGFGGGECRATGETLPEVGAFLKGKMMPNQSVAIGRGLAFTGCEARISCVFRLGGRVIGPWTWAY